MCLIRKKSILFIIIVVIFFSCSNLSNKSIQENSIVQDSTYNTQSELAYLSSLVLSSNLEAFNTWPKENIYIYSDSYKTCTNEYIFNVMSAHNKNETEVNDVTIATIYYNVIKKELYDISSYRSNPVKLKYDKEIEKNLLMAIDNLCGSIPEYVSQKKIDLPFNLGKWSSWYNQEDKKNLPINNQFNYKFIENNYILNFILEANPLHSNMRPKIYFLLNNNQDVFTYLILSDYIEESYKTDKYYDIISIKNDSIISSILVGNIPLSSNDDGKSFNIDESIEVTVYDQLMCSELEFACDTMKTTTYQIENDGQIKKESEIFNPKFEEIEGVIRRK